MTFDEKFAKCIQNLENTDKPDYPESELNYYADFIELIALFSKNNGVTASDVQDRFFGKKEYGNITFNNEDSIFIYEKDDYLSSYSENVAKSKDKDESLIKSIFEIIQERITLYENDYPFEYKNREIVLLKQNLTFNNKLDLFHNHPQ